MDNIKLVFSLIFIFFSASSYSATWIPGGLTTAIVKTVDSLKVSVGLNTPTNTLSLIKSSSFTGSSTAAIPKVSSSLNIPLGATGAALSAVLKQSLTKQALATAGLAMLRSTPSALTAVAIGWAINAGYNALVDSSGHIAITSTVYSSVFCQNKCTIQWGASCSGSFVNMGGKPVSSGADYQCGGYWPDGSPHLLAFYTTSSEAPATNVTPSDPSIITKMASTPVSGASDTGSTLDSAINEQIANKIYADTDGSLPALTGPTSPIPISGSVTTSPAGDVTTKKNEITPAFSGNTVTLTEKETITTVPASGPTTTTVTDKSPDIAAPSAPPVTQPEAATPQQTDCDKYPNSIGCSQYGSVPAADVIPQTDVAISITPTSWGSGTCPAPRTLSLLTTSSKQFSYQPICDFMNFMRPVVIGIGWLMAGFIVLGTVKE
jgi:hypothetical protein